MRKIRVMISGGGTGGHIFPAVSIARKIRELSPESEILFVGAEGKMEMEKVPAEGFDIVGLPIAGLQRRLTVKNLIGDAKVPFKVVRSLLKARKLIREFRPDIVVGVGGYASAPLLWEATRLGVPSLIQEQNGFAGLTNRILGGRVQSICVAYDGMEKFFPKDRIVFSGNPIRPEMHPFSDAQREEGLRFYGLDPAKKHILVVGGSLGSATLNRAMRGWIEAGRPGGENVEILWQCGRYYKGRCDEFMKAHAGEGVFHTDFIGRMDLAYAMADLIISRAGASSVSEICACRKAAIFVPSPNVAEDHQTHNAMALVRQGAGMIVRDAEAPEKLLGVAMEALSDMDGLRKMEENAGKLARMDAAGTIVNEINRILG